MRPGMLLGAIVGAILSAAAALKAACTNLSVLTAAIAAFNLAEFLLSRNFVSLCGLVAALAGIGANAYAAHRARGREELLRRVADLTARLGDRDALEASDRRTIEALKDDVERAAVERQAMNLQLAQVSAEMLRVNGEWLPAGSPHPLRPFSAPASETDVLVVEDDEATRYAMGRVLRHYGFRVVEAATVGEAMEQLRGRARVGPPFGFVLLDLRFPGGETGLDILRAIRSGPPGTLAIIVSGGLDEGAVDRLIAAGAAAVLIKPVDKERLLTLMGLRPEDRDAIAAAVAPTPETPGA